MLTIIIPKTELYFEATNEFTYFEGGKLILEHSLLSVKKWEAKHHVPFLDEKEKTAEEILDYIKCMTISVTPDSSVYEYITQQNIDEILKYISDPMTATWFGKEDSKRVGAAKKGEVVTAEIIYYWMISCNIPVEFEKWHLSQLLTLIKVFSVKNKKQDPKQAAIERARLNEERKAKYKTRG